MVALAGAYGIAARQGGPSRPPWSAAIADTLAVDGPALLDVVMDPEQGFAPKVIAEKLPDGLIVSKPLEDMLSWLDPEGSCERIWSVDPYRRDPREHTVNELERKMVHPAAGPAREPPCRSV